MQAEQVNMPNQEEVQMPCNQKAHADLLVTIMDIIEKYQEGETGEGNYLKAMNALRDLHKFGSQLRGSVVYQYYEAVARAPAPPPARVRAARKKLNDDEKRANGYVECNKCGRLFSERSKLRRHQETTEICRHITHEKEVAVQTKRVERVKVDKKRRAPGASVTALITPPDDHCITKKDAFYGTFLHSMLLFLEGRQHQVATILARQSQAVTTKLNGTAQSFLITPQMTAFQIMMMRNKEKTETIARIKKENLYDAYMHSMLFENGSGLRCMIAEQMHTLPASPLPELVQRAHQFNAYIDPLWSTSPASPDSQDFHGPTEAELQQFAEQGNQHDAPEYSPTGSPPLSPEDAHAMEILMHYADIDIPLCPHCKRNEKECEEQTEEEKNPITYWCGGWGVSCDDCYYKNHPEEEEADTAHAVTLFADYESD
jgi:hypothetical protein